MFSHRHPTCVLRARCARRLSFSPVFSTAAFAQGLVEKATGNAMRAEILRARRAIIARPVHIPKPIQHRSRPFDGRQRLQRQRLRPSRRLRVLVQHQQSRRQRHDVDLPEPEGTTAGRRSSATTRTPARRASAGRCSTGDNTFGWARLSTGEGWYFSGTRPNALYINEPPASRLFRYDVLAHSWETVFDMAGQFPGKYLWQVHSSNDDRVHSFTVRDKGSYVMEGCAIYREDQRKLGLLRAQGQRLRRVPDRQERQVAAYQGRPQRRRRRRQPRDRHRQQLRADSQRRWRRRPLRHRLRLHGGGRQLQ